MRFGGVPSIAASVLLRPLRVLAKSDIRISKDGKGAWRDNVFVERLRHSVKYEDVYLHAYDTVSAACDGIGRYLYNCRLDGLTPD